MRREYNSIEVVASVARSRARACVCVCVCVCVCDLRVAREPFRKVSAGGKGNNIYELVCKMNEKCNWCITSGRASPRAPSLVLVEVDAGEGRVSTSQMTRCSTRLKGEDHDERPQRQCSHLVGQPHRTLDGSPVRITWQ